MCFVADIYERRNDRASDCLIDDGETFTLDDEILIGGYCIDRPSVSPAGSCITDRFFDVPVSTVRIDQ